MKLLSASFFWQNDKPTGLGVTFSSHHGFSPGELTDMFAGRAILEYFAESDAQLGTSIVRDYLSQLAGIAADARKEPLPLSLTIIAAWNIAWLSDRGFIPNDEFNGPMLTYTE